MLTADRLRIMVRYEPETGLFFPLKARSGPKRKRLHLGTLTGNGYFCFRVDGVTYQAHRLAWLYMTGDWPKAEIDHRNRRRSDNRWENLREATDLENPQNRSRRSDNKSGATGIYLHGLTGKWAASIAANGNRKHLGLFENIEDARAAYAAEKAVFHAFQPEVVV